MPTQADIGILQDMLFGVETARGNEASIRADIDRKMAEVQELHRKLREIKSGGFRKASSEEVQRILQSECPYMDIVHRRQPDRGVTMSGTGASFTIEVKNAPFHVFDRSGRALHSTLPANTLGLRVTSGSVSTLNISDDGWMPIKRTLYSNGSLKPEFSEKIRTRYSFGHPHCPVRIGEGGGGSVSSSRMCFGNNDMRRLLANMDSQGTMILALKAAYAWLTELTAGDSFHTDVSPVMCSGEWMTQSVVPDCAKAKSKVLEFLKSPDYVAFINAIRKGGSSVNIVAMFPKAYDMLRGIPGIENSYLMRQANQLHSALTGQHWHDCVLSLGMHQLLADTVILADTVPWNGLMAYNSARAGMAVLATVWEREADSKRLVSPSGFTSRLELCRYVADWEVIRNGNRI